MSWKWSGYDGQTTVSDARFAEIRETILDPAEGWTILHNGKKLLVYTVVSDKGERFYAWIHKDLLE